MPCVLVYLFTASRFLWWRRLVASDCGLLLVPKAFELLLHMLLREEEDLSL
jgi:hypothetical protein